MNLQEQDTLIAELYKQGYSCRSISLSLGKSPGYAFDRLKRKGIDTRRSIDDRLTDEEKEEICNRYAKGESAKNILPDFSPKIISENSIIRVVRNRGLQVRPAKRYTPVDETYFDAIDTPEKAYVLGLLLADGYVIYPPRGKTPFWGIGLKEEDRYLLEFIRKEVKAEKKKFNVRQDDGFANFCITSKHMVDSLEKYSICPRKTYTVTYPENIPQKYNKDVIRGYFDGNGSVTNGRCFFYGNERILTSIRDLLVAEAGITFHKVAYNRFNHIWYFSFSRKSEAESFRGYIYRDANIYMKRKFEKLCDKTM